MSETVRVRVFDIQYDTDGQVVDLPTELIFDDVERSDVYDLADRISDKTGFCVFGYSCEIPDEQ